MTVRAGESRPAWRVWWRSPFVGVGEATRPTAARDESLGRTPVTGTRTARCGNHCERAVDAGEAVGAGEQVHAAVVRGGSVRADDEPAALVEAGSTRADGRSGRRRGAREDDVAARQRRHRADGEELAAEIQAEPAGGRREYGRNRGGGLCAGRNRGDRDEDEGGEGALHA